MASFSVREPEVTGTTVAPSSAMRWHWALPPNVLAAHIDHAFQAVTGADRRGGNTMLTRRSWR